MSFISLIIPSYRRAETLKKTLDIIEKSISLPDEIIIVDQTEQDKGQDQIEQLCNGYPLINYVHQDTPSLTKARNKGIDVAKGDILIFMDDDVDVRPNTFLEIRELMAYKDIAMIGGLDEGCAVPYARSNILFFKASQKNCHIGHVTPAVYGRFPISIDREIIETQWAMGFFFVVRRELISKYNLKFDEKLQYYAYAEDLDFSYRYYRIARSVGMQCIMTPRIIVKHNVSKEYRLISDKAYCMMYAHRWYLCHKLFGNLKSKLAFLWSNFGDIILYKRNRQSFRRIMCAQLFWFRYQNSIKHGVFHYDKFM